MAPIADAKYPDLAAFLEESGETQLAVAEAVDTTQATISRIAAGDMMPRPRLAARLVRYCRIPMASFARVYLAAHREDRRSA